jgi:protein-disulfide isomerase
LGSDGEDAEGKDDDTSLVPAGRPALMDHPLTRERVGYVRDDSDRAPAARRANPPLSRPPNLSSRRSSTVVFRSLPRLLLGLGFAVIALLPWRPSAAADFTPAQVQAIQSIVRDYLTKNPDMLVGALHAAEAKLDRDADAKTASLIAGHRQEIYDNPQTPVGGNPQGKVTLVEFFDYRCPYCKETQPSLDKLEAKDPQLRVVYKEFPILGPVSVSAAHAALAAARQGKYEAFHRALMNAHGNLTDDTVFRIAESVGLDVAQLKHDMATPQINEAIEANMKLADALGINGTPAFVIGDQVVPGAVDMTGLKKLVADPAKE